jgi:hypothetical protein
MHVAPPVRVSLGRSPAWAAFVALLCGAGAGNGAAWALMHLDAKHLMPGALFAACITAAVGAAWSWRAQAPGALVWDGSSWWWCGREGSAHAAIDLNRWLLLRFEPSDGRRQWLAASARHCVGPWNELRAALHSPRLAEPQDAPPPG